MEFDSKTRCVSRVDEFARELRLCGRRKDLQAGKLVHSRICESDLENTTYLGNLLVEMYGRCGCLDEARTAFDNIKNKNVYSWNIMLTAYATNGHLQEARKTFDHTPQKNPVSWTAMVAAYAQRGDLFEANTLFQDMPAQTIASWNAMITGHAIKGDLPRARELFDLMPERDIASWNAMITAYSQAGQLQRATEIFDMVEVSKRNVITWTTMLTAYATNGHLLKARKLFDEMPGRNLITWTSMIAGYADTGNEDEAIKMFKRMDLDGTQPDHMAYVTVIDACSKLEALADGIEIHQDILHAGSWISKRVVLGTALVTMYGRCGKPEQAREVFDSMPEKSEVSWSSMISAYSQNRQGRLAIALFRAMDLEGVGANEITLVSVFDACSSLPDLAYGKLLHSETSTSSIQVATALINLYGKSGCLHLAKEMFDESSHKPDVVLWTAMITAHARNGLVCDAVELYRQMQVLGVDPNWVTVLAVLSISSHSGKLEFGYECFRSLFDYGIPASLDHYVCMVDLLARLGRVKEAEELIHTMPFEPHSVPLMALLSSCSRACDDIQTTMNIAKELTLSTE